MEPITVVKTQLTEIGRHALSPVLNLGKGAIFFLNTLVHMFSLPLQVSKTIQQTHYIGAKSIFVICLTGAFTGMVLGLQGYYTLVKFGSEGVLGAAVALSLIREMGPVLTAIMVIGRAGSAMAAEIGIMRISEEIDALETMDINAIRYLVSPKMAAALISFPLLTAFFDVVGIIGGYATGVVLLGIDSGIFFARMESAVSMNDITGGFVKSFVFAAVVSTVCCFKGYFTHLRTDAYGAKGVSLSTTSAVVASCILVLITDYIITSFLL